MARKLTLVLGAALVALVALELGFRLLAPRLGVDEQRLRRYRAYAVDGEVAGFQPFAHTLFRRSFAHPDVNAQGFRDAAWKRERTPGVYRIACLGGSTTEGASEGSYPNAFPYLLEVMLENAAGLELEVMNCGVSGWTSAETVVAWFLLIKDYAPDLVVWHHAVNDVSPELWPNFAPDYSHYRRHWEVPRAGAAQRALIASSDLFAWLAARADPPDIGDVTLRPRGRGEPGLPGPPGATYRRNLLSVARDVSASGGAVCLVTMPARPPADGEGAPTRALRSGIARHNAILRAVAEEEGYLLVDVAAFVDEHPEAGDEFVDLVHVTTRANAGKAHMIAEELQRSWVPGLTR